MDEHAEFLARPGLSLERLATLCAFAEAGTLTRAADGSASKLSLYSRQVQDLQEFFGVPLTRREGRVAVPTAAARELAVLARAALGSLHEFQSAAKDVPPRLTVAAAHSVLEWWVAPRAEALERALPPGTKLVLLELRTREVADAVLRRQADLGILREDAIPAPLKRRKVTRFGYRLFVRAALVRGRSAEDLLREVPIAVAIGGRFREDLEAAARHAGVTINVALECASFSLAAAAVRTGRYGAVLPSIAAPAFGPKVACLPLPFRPEPVRTLAAAWHPGGASRWLPALRDALLEST